MDFRAVRQEVAELCHYIYEKGYTQASGGNLSCRVPGTELVAIKKIAVNMRIITDADVLIMNTEGNMVYGDGKLSKEAGFYSGALKPRPEMNAFIHYHPNYSIVPANNNIELPFTSVTARKVVGHVPFIESAPAGSEDLCRYVIDAFRDHPENKGILMKEHDVCVVGPSLEAAYNVVDLTEQTAKQACIQVQVVVNRNKSRELFQVWCSGDKTLRKRKQTKGSDRRKH